MIWLNGYIKTKNFEEKKTQQPYYVDLNTLSNPSFVAGNQNQPMGVNEFITNVNTDQKCKTKTKEFTKFQLMKLSN